MATAGLTKAPIPTTLSQKEQNLIALLRKVSFGVVEVSMVEGQPDRVVRIRESVKL